MMQTLSQNVRSALKKNLVPGVVLQFFAATTAFCYFYYEPAGAAFTYLSDLKSQYGWKYAMLSTSLFGGLIPFIYLVLTKKISEKIVAIGLFYVLFWAYKGIEIDFLYQLQENWFGTGHDAGTIAKKTIVDQFIYGTLWAAPSMAIAYLWKDKLLKFRQTFSNIDKSFLFVQIPTTLITNWIIWIPSVLIIYSMPSDLQIPMFNFVLCFFVLLLSSISKNHTQEKRQAESY